MSKLLKESAPPKKYHLILRIVFFRSLLLRPSGLKEENTEYYEERACNVSSVCLDAHGCYAKCSEAHLYFMLREDSSAFVLFSQICHDSFSHCNMGQRY